MGKIVCPECGLNDEIKRVPGIIAEGTASVQMSGPTGAVFNVGGDWGAGGGWTRLTGVQQTNLAKSLTPPPDPRVGAGIGCGGWAIVAFLAYVTFANCWMIVIGLSTFIAGFAGGGFENVLFGLLLASIGIGIMYFAGRAALRKYRSNATLKEEAEANGPAWEAMMTIWERSYYCKRDYIVFDPTAGETTAPTIQAPADDKPPEHFA